MMILFNGEDWKNNFTWEKRFHKEKNNISQKIPEFRRNCGSTNTCSSSFNKFIWDQITLGPRLIFNSNKTLSLLSLGL